MSIDLPMPGLGRPVPTPAAGCDCSSCPFFIDNPQAAEPICSGCSPSCEYCGCARAEDPSRGDAQTGACTRCPIRCGSRPDIGAWMHDVGGTLRFDDLTITGSVPALPRFVPQVDGHDIPALDASLDWPAYAVGLRRILSPASHRIYPRFANGRVHTALGLHDGQKAILIGYGEDPLVEAYWSRRHADELATTLAAQGWDLVLAPNTSMYANQPRAENLLNMRRNLMLAAELAEAGIAAAPCVYWLRLEDLDRYLDWLDTLPAGGPPALAVNLQTFRTSSDWEEMALPGLAYLAAALPADLPIVLVGASRADRITVLSGFFGDRLHLISQNPLQYARHGAVMTPDGRRDVHARVEDLFVANVRYYAGLLDEGGGAPAEDR